MKIKDINGLDNGLTLVTDSQDVEAIDQYLGQGFVNSHGYFVHTKDGDYDRVLYFEGTVPWLYKEITVIR